MYLSCLRLNIRDRRARHLLARPYEMHRALWQAFPNPEPGRILFRVDFDPEGNPPMVLVQSELPPNWERLDSASMNYLIAPPKCKPLELSFGRSQRLRFRLRANPTKKVGSSSKKDRLSGKKDNGGRVALLKETEQVAWLLSKGSKGGFTIPGQWTEERDGSRSPNFRVETRPEGWCALSKENHTAGRFFAVRFDGVLVVTDPDAFVKTWSNGIGSAKGLGFGLLSIAPDRG